MTFAEEIRNTKYITATITVGQFDIKYQWLPNVAFNGTMFGWDCFAPDGFDGTPEQDHLEKYDSVLDKSGVWYAYYEEEYMDALVAALEQNPFQPKGE